MPTTSRCHLPVDALGRYPQLSYLVNEGLPPTIRWQLRPTAPEYCFDFELLAHGGTHYDEVLVERSRRYLPDLGNMLRIGRYLYSFLDLRQQSDVCRHVTDGALWIIDLSRESIVTHIHNNEPVGERIPIFFQYVNSGGEQFEKCLTTYLGYVERFRKPTRDATAVRNAWLQFEEYIRQTDPQALTDDSSYWQCIIGERLGPY